MKIILFGVIGSSIILSGCSDQLFLSRQQQVQQRIAMAKSNELPVAPPNSGTTVISAQQIYNQSRTPSTAAAPARPVYAGPHNYSVVRGNTYGYTEAKNGEIHFFRYDGFKDGHYRLVSFEDTQASMVVCEGDCKIVRVMSYGFDRTYQVKSGSVLALVIQDMLRGALSPSL